MSVLDGIDLKKLKQLNIDELKELCREIREVIVKTVTKNGGHLSPSLGTVELIVALCYVYDFDADKLIFDVGHQSYAYKILTDRLNKFDTIRKEGGLSGFPDPLESDYDAFTAGHAGSSISAGLGYAYARDRLNENYNVINLVGDASFFNGENLEAASISSVKPNNFLVILNDNGMSIGKNENGLYKFVSKITISRHYHRFNALLSKTIGKTFILGKLLKRFKRRLKSAMSINTIADNLGMKYVGVFDGHDLKTLIAVLKKIKSGNEAVFLHIKTVKGKGFDVAESDSTAYHGVGAELKASVNSFSEAVSPILNDIADKDDKIVAITAGMTSGVGLTDFKAKHPDRFMDVGIAEESAVTIAAGMAKGGIKPIVFIYSTFLQRSYDQIIEDVCLQNLPVVFCLDRAGLVGADGKTHQGVFDLTYLKSIPNLTVLAPKNVGEFEKMLKIALTLNSPVAIRYPNGTVKEIADISPFTDSLNWEVLVRGKKSDVTILAVGGRMLEKAFSISESLNGATVVNARTVKPLDTAFLDSIASDTIVTLEENVKSGGFGEAVAAYFAIDVKKKVMVFALDDKFIEHASVSAQQDKYGLSVQNIISAIKKQRR